MGMFDEISIKCPKCGKYFTEQSRMGECILTHYYLDDLPILVAQDLLESKVYCPYCSARINFVPKKIIKLIPYIED